MINNYFLNHNNIMKILKKENLILFIPLLILTIISLFNMVNAKLLNPIYNNIWQKQLIWFILGFLLIIIMQKLELKKIFKVSKYLYLIGIILLILVLFIGTNINGAKCWLSFKGISFQPSEFMKLALALYLVDIKNKKVINNLKDEFFILMKVIVLTLIPSLLVFLEPDTGAIINYLLILLVIIFSLKLNKWWYISAFAFGSILLGAFFILYFFFQDILIKLIGTSFFYRMDRLINFANGSSYQLTQALITIGASSFFGVGFNKILIYIPEAPTDFVFAFSLGNFGIFSGLLIIISLLIIDIYLICKTNKLNKKFKTFGWAYLSILLFHQVYNIAMNLGLLPIMGIPLPFLSYGGTNTIINFIFLGFLLKFINTQNYS